jgi:hypothetical protein
VDTLIVPGGSTVVRESEKPPLLKWLKKQAGDSRRVSSACIGAFMLAKAGLLDGRRATTHWAYAKQLATEFPEVKVDPEPIWVRDGNVYTSAGGTSAIDLSLALLEEDHGRKIALEVARMLVVFLCRPGNQAQFSVSLQDQTTENRPLRDLQIWMLDHIADDLSVPVLAGALCGGNPLRGGAAKAGAQHARHGGDRERVRLQQRGRDGAEFHAPAEVHAGGVSLAVSFFRDLIGGNRRVAGVESETGNR